MGRSISSRYSPSDFISDLDFISVEWIGYILFRQTIKIGFLHKFLRITKTNRDSFKTTPDKFPRCVFLLFCYFEPVKGKAALRTRWADLMKIRVLSKGTCVKQFNFSLKV